MINAFNQDVNNENRNSLTISRNQNSVTNMIMTHLDDYKNNIIENKQL